jgi:hypothetical protein
MLELVWWPTSAFFSVQNNLLKPHFGGGQFAPEKVVSLRRITLVNFTGFSKLISEIACSMSFNQVLTSLSIYENLGFVDILFKERIPYCFALQQINLSIKYFL